MEQASKITHAHERSVLACKIYALLMYYLIADQSRGSLLFALDDIYCRYCEEKEYPHFARIFDENFANLPVDEIKSTGYVVDSLEAAIWCLLNTDNYKDCVLKAVNLGGDTDTIAAIAGGLAGLMYGYESIPQEWLDKFYRRMSFALFKGAIMPPYPIVDAHSINKVDYYQPITSSRVNYKNI